MRREAHTPQASQDSRQFIQVRCPLRQAHDTEELPTEVAAKRWCAGYNKSQHGTNMQARASMQRNATSFLGKPGSASTTSRAARLEQSDAMLRMKWLARPYRGEWAASSSEGCPRARALPSRERRAHGHHACDHRFVFMGIAVLFMLLALTKARGSCCDTGYIGALRAGYSVHHFFRVLMCCVPKQHVARIHGCSDPLYC